jgi:acetyltransferase
MVAIGRVEKLGRIVGSIMPDNRGMQRVCEKLSFHLLNVSRERLVKAEIEL